VSADSVHVHYVRVTGRDMGGLSKYRKSASLALPRTKKRISVCKQREEAGILLSVPRVQGVPATTPAINFSLVSLTPAIRQCCQYQFTYIWKRKISENSIYKCKLPSNKLLTKYENKNTSNFSLLSPVSLKLLINIHSRISPRIFEKIRNDPNEILRGPGETDSWKKLEA
jgi:hypothetical protein